MPSAICFCMRLSRCSTHCSGFHILDRIIALPQWKKHSETFAREVMSLSGQANTHAMREFRHINDRLSTILPTVGAFRRRSMPMKWLSCKGLQALFKNYSSTSQELRERLTALCQAVRRTSRALAPIITSNSRSACHTALTSFWPDQSPTPMPAR